MQAALVGHDFTIDVVTDPTQIETQLRAQTYHVVILDYVTRRTPFGRHIYAVGGNAEAARRAGISVNGIRVAVFCIASFMAAAGGIAVVYLALAYGITTLFYRMRPF